MFITELESLIEKSLYFLDINFSNRKYADEVIQQSNADDTVASIMGRESIESSKERIQALDNPDLKGEETLLSALLMTDEQMNVYNDTVYFVERTSDFFLNSKGKKKIEYLIDLDYNLPEINVLGSHKVNADKIFEISREFTEVLTIKPENALEKWNETVLIKHEVDEAPKLYFDDNNYSGYFKNLIGKKYDAKTVTKQFIKLLRSDYCPKVL